MKTFWSPSAWIAVSTLGLVTSVWSQQPAADQKQSAPPPKAEAAARPPAEPGLHPAAAAAEQRKPLLAQPESPAINERTLPGTIRAAPKGIEQRTARALDGRKVRGSDDSDLGKVKDFLIDARSGEVAYAVVSSGGIRVREQLRLVPFKALNPGRHDRREFAVPMTTAQWEALGAVNETEFESGRLTLSDGDRRELAQRFERAQSGDAATGSAFYTQAISAHLVRAQKIRGSDVFVADKKVGTIDDVIIDERAATASALFDPSSRLTEAKEKFVVPLNRYSFGTTRSDRITTTITRADFETMRTIVHEASPPTPPSPTGQTAGAPPAVSAGKAPAGAPSTPPEQKPVAKDQRPGAAAPAQKPQQELELAPTGRTAAEQKKAAPSAAEPLSAAKAIRAALDQEAAAVARIDVDVNAENGRIVLRGSVADERLKKLIEEKATRAAQGAPIDSQIAIENKPASASGAAPSPPPKQPATPPPPRDEPR